MWQGMDQRRFPRRKCQCIVNLRQPERTSPISTTTENVGLGGVCVLLERALDIFSPVDVDLVLEDRRPPLRVLGTIVWVVRRRGLKKGPSFDTGIEFAELSTEQKARLEAVIDRHP